jgi:hypothetical protein
LKYGVRLERDSAEDESSDSTFAPVIAMFRDFAQPKRSAAAPATTGDAIDVP